MPYNVPSSGSILYICDDCIGDVVVALDNVHELKRAFPHVLLHVVCNDTVAGIFVADPHVDRILVADIAGRASQPYPPQVCGVHYTLVLNSRLDAASYHFMKTLSYDHAFGFESCDWYEARCTEIYRDYIPLSVWDKQFKAQSADVTLGSLIRFVSPEYQPMWPRIYLDIETQRQVRGLIARHGWAKPLMAVFPGASAPSRRWPMNRFIDIAMTLNAHYQPVFVFGPAEASLLRTYRDALLKLDIGIVCDSDLPTLASLYSLARLNISNDSGPMHVACAVDCPTVAIFGGTVSSMWFPYDRNKHRVVEKSCAVDLACHECPARNNCIRDIRTEDVYDAATSLLGF